jgi:molybdopterin-guanine dinucleotide biosynthesis protein A
MGGGDKPLLELAGRPMLERIIAALDVQSVAISANGDLARFARFQCPVLPDGVLAGEGPLAGVLAGLDWAAGLGLASLLTVPGDVPFIPQGLAHKLAPPPSCAASNDRHHPLVALWPIHCRDKLRSLLAAPGRRDVRHFARYIGMRRVDFPVAKWDPFMNVNTPEDLAVARTIAEAQS